VAGKPPRQMTGSWPSGLQWQYRYLGCLVLTDWGLKAAGEQGGVSVAASRLEELSGPVARGAER
jgi:hypothetical protein